MKLQVKFSNRFKSDLKLAKKQNKNLDKLFLVIEKLANLEKLDDKYRDHSLVGEYKGLRECQPLICLCCMKVRWLRSPTGWAHGAR